MNIIRRKTLLRLIIGIVFIVFFYGNNNEIALNSSIENEKLNPDKYFSIEYKEKVDPLKYYPLAVGNKWTYENEYRAAIRGNGKIYSLTWISEISITGHLKIDEGIIILREFNFKDTQFHYSQKFDEDELSWSKSHIPNREVSHYLIQSNYIYAIPKWGLDKLLINLTDRYKEGLKSGSSGPEFFFPMDKVQKWSTRNREEADFNKIKLAEQGKGPWPNPGLWYVNVDRLESLNVPYGKIQDAYLLRCPDNTGAVKIWFKSGLGVVREWYRHRGSYYEGNSVLKKAILN